MMFFNATVYTTEALKTRSHFRGSISLSVCGKDTRTFSIFEMHFFKTRIPYPAAGTKATRKVLPVAGS